MKLEAVRRWITTLALAGLSLAALIAVLRPPAAGAVEESAELAATIEECGSLSAPLARLDCYDLVVSKIAALGTSDTEQQLKTCEERTAPLERLDCYQSVTVGQGVPEAWSPPRPTVDAAPAGSSSPAAAACYTVPPGVTRLHARDLAERTVRDHVEAGRVRGMFILDPSSNGSPLDPWTICAW